MPLKEIIERRTSAILRSFEKETFPPLMSASPQTPLDSWAQNAGGQLVKLKGDEVLRFQSCRSPDLSFTMVRPDFPAYRQEYIGFINDTYNTSFEVQDIPADFDVDHLLAVSNTPSSNWTRLEAVYYRSNRSHGAGIEKKNSRSSITIARKAAQHWPSNMTWLVAAKLARLKSPLSPSSKSSMPREQDLIDYFTSQGFKRAFVESGLRMCKHEIQEIILELSL